MTGSVEMRLDGSTLIVRIPMRFRRRGGRKRIVAPDGRRPPQGSRPSVALAKTARRWRLHLGHRDR
jgi:hypothetical protein